MMVEHLRNENGEVYYMEADNTIEEWLVDGNEDSEYYFQAVKKEETGVAWNTICILISTRLLIPGHAGIKTVN